MSTEEKVEIETFNKFMVSVTGPEIHILNPSAGTGAIRHPMRLTHDDALLLAAYLVSLAYSAKHEFKEVLAAVENT